MPAVDDLVAATRVESDAEEAAPRHRWLRWFDPLVLGVIAVLVTGFRSWSPSFWHDEAATITASTRAPADILRLLTNVDAVHGVYYFGMHLWLLVAPLTEFWVRLPSVIAVGLATAGVVVLGKLVANRPIALIAAVVFLVLPRMTSAGIEARSYSLSAALAVWTTVVFVVAIRRRGATIWALYAILLAAGTMTFVYAGLLVLAHLATLCTNRRLWRKLPAFVVAGAIGVLLATPLAMVIQSQAKQVSWIQSIGQNRWQTIFADQYFDGSWLAAAVVLSILLVGAAIGIARRPRTGVDAEPGLLGIALPWVVLPVVTMLLYSLLVDDMFLGRYFTFTAPAFALLVAMGLWCISRAFAARSTVVTVVLLVGVIAAAAPRYVEQRQPFAKPSGMDYSQVAAFIADDARPGDCVLYQLTNTWNPAPMRAVEVSRPSAFHGLDDVSLGKTGAELGELWDQTVPTDQLAPELRQCSKVWLLTDSTQHYTKSDNYRAIESDGFHVEESTKFNVSEVVLFAR